MNELPGFSHPAEAQILARIPEAVRERARAVRMMVFDVDGILTVSLPRLPATTVQTRGAGTSGGAQRGGQ